MGYSVSVLCRSTGEVTPDYLIEIIEDEIDFVDDYAPVFDPARSGATDWTTLNVQYAGSGLIQILRGDFDLLQGVVAETIDQHGISGALADRLRETRSMITIRPHGTTDQVEIDKGVWEMLAVLLHNVARDHDGLIVDHRGVRDADLEFLVGG